MLLRSIPSKLQRNHRFANFSSLTNVEPNLTPSSSPSSTTTQQRPLEKGYVISYLINSCGLSPSKALSASKKLDFDNPDRPNAVLNFFQNQGFTKPQISEIVKRYPLVLLSKPEKTILPKIEFFVRSSGVSEKDVISTFSKHPYLLTMSLERRLAPMYDYFKDIMGGEKADILFMRGSWSFSFDLENRIIPNVDYLRGLGVPALRIEFSMFHIADIFWPKPDVFRKVVEEVREMGFDVSKSVFVLAIHARSGRSNLALWERCYEVYRKWGWSREEILMAFGKHPNCMLLSEKKISGVMDFMVKEMGREPGTLAWCPHILFFNMEKRIVPRCTVVQLLCEKGLVKKDWSLSSVIHPTEKVFLETFVKRYAEEMPQLYDIYRSKIGRVVE